MTPTTSLAGTAGTPPASVSPSGGHHPALTWRPDEEPPWTWFHKYVVTRVALGDDAVGYRLDGDQVQARGQLRAGWPARLRLRLRGCARVAVRELAAAGHRGRVVDRLARL